MGKDKLDMQKMQRKLQKEFQKRKIQIFIFLIMSHFEAKMISLYHLTGKNLYKALSNINYIFRRPMPDYSFLDYIKCAGVYSICVLVCYQQ